MRPFLCLLLTFVVVLAGCSSGPKKRVFPPQARIQQLEVDAGGHWQLKLRLENFSTVPMRFARIEAELAVDDVAAGTLTVADPIDTAASSVEVVAADLQPSAEAAARLAAALADGRGIGYRLQGRIVADQPHGEYPFEFASRLDPVPGLERVLR